MSRLRACLASLILVAGLPACGTVAAEQRSDHFDGRRFYNAEPDHSFGDMLRWLWEMKTVAWPDWIEDPPQPAPQPRVSGGRLVVTYVNHATFLIQTEGLNILTDPMWSMRASPVAWAGPRRVRNSGVRFEDLPPIDVVLLSHDHYDHTDEASLRRLEQRDHPLVLSGAGSGPLLRAFGLARVITLDWWQTHDLSPAMRITFVPALHQSGRGLFDGNSRLWGGFVISSPSGNIYFAGDTALGGFLPKLQAAFGRFRLAILPIGSYEKRWFMQHQHMNPEDAVRVHQALQARQSVGMHYATFVEHPEQGIAAHVTDLEDAMARLQVPPDRFRILAFGESLEVDKSRDE